MVHRVGLRGFTAPSPREYARRFPVSSRGPVKVVAALVRPEVVPTHVVSQAVRTVVGAKGTCGKPWTHARNCSTSQCSRTKCHQDQFLLPPHVSPQRPMQPQVWCSSASFEFGGIQHSPACMRISKHPGMMPLDVVLPPPQDPYEFEPGARNRTRYIFRLGDRIRELGEFWRRRRRMMKIVRNHVDVVEEGMVREDEDNIVREELGR